MKGLTDILLSCILAVAALLLINSVLKPKRASRMEVPVVSAGPSTDPNLSLSWGAQQIHAPIAWTQSRGSRNVTVAVIDTGCDVHHPDLSSNIWTNPGESGLDENGNPRGSNAIDDDNNGYVDDVHGWNFAGENADLSDDHGHGTHIAGIIGGTPQTYDGGVGTAPQVNMMILKYFGSEADGKKNLLNTIAAIRYAVKMGADIINYSGGGIIRSGAEEEALRWAAKQGVLVVAAAGNEGLNSDFFHFYPADYDLPNILSVAAVDQHERLLPISNFGVETVDLAAPGKNIYSTLPNGQHGYMTGTSQATAFVSGVAALLIAHDPRLRNPEALIQHLLTHSSRRQALRGKLKSASLLDAALALNGSEVELSAVRQQSSVEAN